MQSWQGRLPNARVSVARLVPRSYSHNENACNVNGWHVPKLMHSLPISRSSPVEWLSRYSPVELAGCINVELFTKYVYVYTQTCCPVRDGNKYAARVVWRNTYIQTKRDENAWKEIQKCSMHASQSESVYLCGCKLICILTTRSWNARTSYETLCPYILSNQGFKDRAHQENKALSQSRGLNLDQIHLPNLALTKLYYSGDALLLSSQPSRKDSLADAEFLVV